MESELIPPGMDSSVGAQLTSVVVETAKELTKLSDIDVMGDGVPSLLHSGNQQTRCEAIQRRGMVMLISASLWGAGGGRGTLFTPYAPARYVDGGGGRREWAQDSPTSGTPLPLCAAMVTRIRWLSVRFARGSHMIGKLTCCMSGQGRNTACIACMQQELRSQVYSITETQIAGQ